MHKRQHLAKEGAESLSSFIQGVYAARGDPDMDLPEKFAQELTELRALCEQHRDHPHDKTRGLAQELLNDWDAILDCVR